MKSFLLKYFSVSVFILDSRVLDVAYFVTVYLLVLIVKISLCEPCGATMSSPKTDSQTSTTQSGSGLWHPLPRGTIGYYLPIASYGTIFAAKWSSNGRLEAVVSKWFAQGHKGLTARRCSFCFRFSPSNALFPPELHHTVLRIVRKGRSIVSLECRCGANESWASHRHSCFGDAADRIVRKPVVGIWSVQNGMNDSREDWFLGASDA